MMISDDLICSVLGTPNDESWPGVKQLPDYKPTFPQWSAQNLAEQVPYLDAAGIDLLKVRYLCFNFFSPSIPPSLYRSWLNASCRKHSHMTAPVASPQNAPSYTHTLPITEDRCSIYLLPHLLSSFVSVMHFTRLFIVARICVTFNYPPSFWHYPCNCSITSNLLLFFYSFFCTFLSFQRRFCLVFVSSDRAVCLY